MERNGAEVEPQDVVFPDQEDSIWELDPKTNEWYLHHFYKHQPDLNIENPKVQEEISRTLRLLARARRLGLPGRRRAVPVRKGRGAGKADAFDPFQYLATQEFR